MAVIDIIIVVILAGAAIWGFRKGIVNQLGAVAAIIIGLVASRSLGPALGEAVFHFSTQAADTSQLTTLSERMAAYAVVYFLAYYAVILVARMLRLVVHTVFLGPVDRMAGALFNMLKFCIVLSFLFNFWEFVNPSTRLHDASHLMGGELVDFILAISPAMMGALTN